MSETREQQARELAGELCGCRCHKGESVTCVCGGGWECIAGKAEPLLARALAACALAEHDALCTDCRAHIDTKKYVRCKRGAGLERAAEEGKS